MRGSNRHRLPVGLTLVAGLLGASRSDAQILSKTLDLIYRIPDPRRLPGDIVVEHMTEHRLQRDQAQLQADLAGGDATAVDRDRARIAHDERRVELYRWKVRRDSFQAPGPLPTSGRPAPGPGFVAGPGNPGGGEIQAGPSPPPVAIPPVPITIGNAGPAATGLDFTIDGTAYRSTSGQVKTLSVAPDSIINYDSGGSTGLRRYHLSPGSFEFRPTDAGWALYKLPATSAEGAR